MRHRLPCAQNLIPAHAGVIPCIVGANLIQYPYPRACGGDPKEALKKYRLKDLSPRMRG